MTHKPQTNGAVELAKVRITLGQFAALLAGIAIIISMGAVGLYQLGETRKDVVALNRMAVKANVIHAAGEVRLEHVELAVFGAIQAPRSSPLDAE